MAGYRGIMAEGAVTGCSAMEQQQQQELAAVKAGCYIQQARQSPTPG